MEQQQFIPGNDPVLKDIITRYGMPRIQLRAAGFASMVHIILEQQVSIASAKACYDKIAAYLGSITPDSVLKTDPETFRMCGVSRQKTSYIINMAEMVNSGRLDFNGLESLPADQQRAALLSVKGVGNWSADVYLMFCLKSPDIIPIGDIAIQSALRELYGIESKDEMAVFAERWKPHRTLASYILWQHYLGKRNRL